MDWVEYNLRKVLRLVPKGKLMLGLPFYSRDWVESRDVMGNVTLSNPARTLSMEKQRELTKDNNAKVEWDEKAGQFYTEFKVDASTHRIWIEDSNSINMKSSLSLNMTWQEPAHGERDLKHPKYGMY